MKKILSLILAACMVMSMAAVAFAAGLPAADSNGVITLTADINDGVGVVISSPVVIDLNGHTYNIASNPVGSTGTETLGFQILQSAGDVTIKNGTISTSTDAVKMLIQNYANLTLEDVTLDGTGSDTMKYVLSNNCGDTVLEGETNIYAPGNAVAFDVCDYATYPGVSVTVNTTGVIEGKIEVSGSEPSDYQVELNINSGIFTGEFENQTTVTEKIAVNGGTFDFDVSDYLAPGLEMDGDVVVPAGGTSINPIGGATKPVKGNGLANDNLYTYTKANGFDAVDTDTVTFGTKLYVLLTDASGNAVKADAVKGLSVSDKWTQNGSYVGKVEIVKVGGHYAIVIPTEGSSLEEVQILGNIAVKGKSLYVDNQGKSQKADVKFDVDVEIGLAWPVEDNPTSVEAVTEKKIYDFTDVNEEEFGLTFGTFDVETDTKGMKKVLMSYNDEENDDIVDANPKADLEFVNCEAAFRRTATVTVALENGYFLYEIVDGKLVEVNGEYDEWTEEFTFKTRRLGSYVISDTELALEEVVVANPSTGAAA